MTPFVAWWKRASASPLYLKHPQSDRSVPCGSIAPDYRIPGQTGGLLSAFATCIHCPPGRDNSSSTCGVLESTKRQRNRWRAYVPFALPHLDCSAANGQMIVWSNGHPIRWRERSIARGSNSAPPYSMRFGVSIRLPTQACPLGMSIHLRVQRLSSRRHER